MNIKERLIDIGRKMEESGLATFGPGKGSCSVRDFETGSVYITPSGKSYATVKPDQLVEVNLQGEILQGYKPSADLIFHLEIYRSRPEIGSVIHLHTPYATAFAIIQKPIPVAMQAIANTIGGPIPVSKFALPGTEALGKNIVEAMDGHINAVLLANHGLVTCASNLEECLSIASTVELAAQVTFIASQMGDLVILTEDQVKDARKFYADRFFKKE